MITIAQEFYRVKCNECDNEQNVFSHASTEVECLVCGEPLLTPKGGKAELSASVVKELKPE